MLVKDSRSTGHHYGERQENKQNGEVVEKLSQIFACEVFKNLGGFFKLLARPNDQELYRHKTDQGQNDQTGSKQPPKPVRGVVLHDFLSSSKTGAKDRKSTRLNSSHVAISYAVFCLKKKKSNQHNIIIDQYLH